MAPLHQLGMVGETFGLLVLPQAGPGLPTVKLPDAANGRALKLALGLVPGVYGISALLNRGLPDSGARYPRSVMHPYQQLRQSAQANRRLWRYPQGGPSLAGLLGAAVVVLMSALWWRAQRTPGSA